MGGAVRAAARAEHQALGERVRAQPVCAVQRDAGRFARGVEPGNLRGAVNIGIHSAHHVMQHRAHRNGLVHRIHADVGARQFAHKGQPRIDLRRAEVAQVEMRKFPRLARQRNAAPGGNFLGNGAGDHVAGTEFGLLPHAVIPGDEKALAFGVLQVAAFAPRRLGDQNARARQPRRVILHELHIFQRQAGAVGQRHAVAGFDGAVGGEGPGAPAAAGGENYRAAQNGPGFAVADIQSGHAAAAPVLHQQLRHEVLVEALDALIAQRSLKQRVQNVEADLVGGEPGALGGHAAEGAGGHRAVVVAAPRAAPVFQPHQFLRRALHEILNHGLVAEKVRALHGVVGVGLEAVVRPRHRRRAAFGRDRVAAHGIHLRHQRHAQLRIGLCNRNGRAQTRRAAAHNYDVIVKDRVHALSRPAGRAQCVAESEAPPPPALTARHRAAQSRPLRHQYSGGGAAARCAFWRFRVRPPP